MLLTKNNKNWNFNTTEFLYTAIYSRTNLRVLHLENNNVGLIGSKIAVTEH